MSKKPRYQIGDTVRVEDPEAIRNSQELCQEGKDRKIPTYLWGLPSHYVGRCTVCYGVHRHQKYIKRTKVARKYHGIITAIRGEGTENSFPTRFRYKVRLAENSARNPALKNVNCSKELKETWIKGVVT